MSLVMANGVVPDQEELKREQLPPISTQSLDARNESAVVEIFDKVCSDPKLRLACVVYNIGANVPCSITEV